MNYHIIEHIIWKIYDVGVLKKYVKLILKNAFITQKFQLMTL